MMDAMGFVELHFHLLPGVDDGPKTIEESLALAAAARAEGTEVVITTPHVHEAHVTDPLVLAELVDQLRAELERERISLELRVGGELAHPMVSLLSDVQLDAIAHGPAGRRWVLLEAPFAGLDERFADAADELRTRGFGILLAHPERCTRTPENAPALTRELERGTGFQINAWSIAGRYGDQVRDRAAALLRLAPESPIASDAHGRDRQPALGLGLRALAAAGEGDPRRRVDAIPRRLLAYGLSLPRPRPRRVAA
jgi:protein-tyrosine phosphatase